MKPYLLITSGGTQVALDPIRSITNRSSGRFGSEIAAEALRKGAEVHYLVAEGAYSPFSRTFDFHTGSDWQAARESLDALQRFSEEHGERYREYRYRDFETYARNLRQLTLDLKPDAILLCAAVSDYLPVDYFEAKVRTTEALTLVLRAAPKLIREVKTWSPRSFLVGFKLLVDASETELVQEALKGIEQHHADLVVANNLSSILKGAHEVLLVEPNGRYEKHTQDLAEALIERVMDGLKGRER